MKTIIISLAVIAGVFWSAGEIVAAANKAMAEMQAQQRVTP